MAPTDAHLGGVRWAAEVIVDKIGRWEYTVQAWTDRFGTWRDELERKLRSGTDATGLYVGPSLAGELSAQPLMTTSVPLTVLLPVIETPRTVFCGLAEATLWPEMVMVLALSVDATIETPVLLPL